MAAKISRDWMQAIYTWEWLEEKLSAHLDVLVQIRDQRQRREKPL